MDDSYYFQETPVERIDLLKGGVKEQLESFRLKARNRQSISLFESSVGASVEDEIIDEQPSNQNIILPEGNNTFIPSVFEDDCINDGPIDLTLDDDEITVPSPSPADESSGFIAFGDAIENDGSHNVQQLLDEMNRISPPGLPIWFDFTSLQNIAERNWLPVFDQLHEEILDFSEYMAPSKEELLLRHDLIARYQSVVRSIWPDATLNPFGSQITGLMLPFSDADMILSLPCSDHDQKAENDRLRQLNSVRPGHPTPRLESVVARQAFNSLANELEKRDMARDIEIVSAARVPIIKFRDRETGLSVDICFNNDSGRATAAIMSQALESMPALRHLVIILKFFLYSRSLSETYHGGIGSFLAQLIALATLQHHPSRFISQSMTEENITFQKKPEFISPTVPIIDKKSDKKDKKDKKDKLDKKSKKEEEKKLKKELQKQEEQQRAIPKVSEVDYKVNLGVLLYYMFELFVNKLNYTRVGISVEGRGSLFLKQMKGWANPGRPSLLSIENPCDSSHDVGANSYNIAKVRRSFVFALHSISGIVHAGAERDELRSMIVACYAEDGNFDRLREEEVIPGISSMNDDEIIGTYCTFQKTSSILQKLLPLRPELPIWRHNLPDGAQKRALKRQKMIQSNSNSIHTESDEDMSDLDEDIEELDNIVKGYPVQSKRDVLHEEPLSPEMVSELDELSVKQFYKLVEAYKVSMHEENDKETHETEMKKEKQTHQQTQQQKQKEKEKEKEMEKNNNPLNSHKNNQTKSQKTDNAGNNDDDNDDDDVNNDDYMQVYSEFLRGGQSLESLDTQSYLKMTASKKKQDQDDAPPSRKEKKNAKAKILPTDSLSQVILKSPVANSKRTIENMQSGTKRPAPRYLDQEIYSSDSEDEFVSKPLTKKQKKANTMKDTFQIVPPVSVSKNAALTMDLDNDDDNDDDGDDPHYALQHLYDLSSSEDEYRGRGKKHRGRHAEHSRPQYLQHSKQAQNHQNHHQKHHQHNKHSLGKQERNFLTSRVLNERSNNRKNDTVRLKQNGKFTIDAKRRRKK